MSLILKGVDLPTNGETLIVGIYGNGLVSVEHSKPLVLPIEINADAIQIQKGHGDIIDRNDIYIGRWDIDTDLAEQLLNAPIILESENNNESDT